MDTSQYLNMFLEESMENLQRLNEALLELEKNPEDIDRLNEIFRVAHTIKGMAATMGFNDIADLTHKMEDILSKFREGNLKVSSKVVTVLFQSLDTLERMVSNIAEGKNEKVNLENILKALNEIGLEDEIPSFKEVSLIKDENLVDISLNEYESTVVKEAISMGFNPLAIKVTLREDTLFKSARGYLIVKELEEVGEIIKALPTIEQLESEDFDFTLNFVVITKSTLEEVKGLVEGVSDVSRVEVSKVIALEKNIEKVAKEKPKEGKKKSSAEEKVKAKKSHQSVRVDLERIDKLMDIVSEMVIYRTRLEELAQEIKSVELTETLEEVGRTTSDLQELVMKIRMNPLETVFSRFPRMIRDISKELGKEINFIVEGEKTELDRTVIDEIGEPLIHLLRNAADHGIESKEERIAKGKTPVGTIKLLAYQEGTRALIKVSDDGAGINISKIKAKAEKVGISTKALEDEEIINLIFTEGFSTNEKVTDISGRGVGMDVVKTKISSLGGTLELISEENQGSTFIIRLPLTLQTIQALLIKVGEETLAISLGYINRIIDYKEEQVNKTNGKEVIAYKEQVIPLVRLNERLDIPFKETERKFVIIVNVGEKSVGLLVDSLMGQQEIVIKPLGKSLGNLEEYIGATILGNGLATLILDVGALV